MKQYFGDQAIIEKVEKFDTLLNLLPVGISILGVDQKIIYANHSMEIIFGVSRHELLGLIYNEQKYVRADGSDMPSIEFSSTRAILEKKTIDFVVMGIVQPKGNILWTEVKAIPVIFFDWKVIILTEDITLRKKTEDELKEKERELVESQRLSKIGSWNVVGIDPDESKIFWSQGLMYIMGRDISLPAPSFHDMLAELEDDDAKKYQEVITNAFLTSAPFEIELSLKKKKGRTAEYIISRGEVICDKRGKIVGMRGTAQDITEQKKYRKQIEKNNENLEKINQIMIDRELKIIELKKEIGILKNTKN